MLHSDQAACTRGCTPAAWGRGGSHLGVGSLTTHLSKTIPLFLLVLDERKRVRSKRFSQDLEQMKRKRVPAVMSPWKPGWRMLVKMRLWSTGRGWGHGFVQLPMDPELWGEGS